MNRNQLIDLKAKEIKAQLGKWAIQKNILQPGEQIFFSLRIASIPMVQRNEPTLDYAYLNRNVEPSRQMRWHYRYLRPAQMSADVAEEFLQLIGPRTLPAVRELLLAHNNRATALPDLYDEEVNRYLMSSFQGIRYHLTSEKTSDVQLNDRKLYRYYQLWEIERH